MNVTTVRNSEILETFEIVFGRLYVYTLASLYPRDAIFISNELITTIFQTEFAYVFEDDFPINGRRKLPVIRKR